MRTGFNAAKSRKKIISEISSRREIAKQERKTLGPPFAKKGKKER